MFINMLTNHFMISLSELMLTKIILQFMKICGVIALKYLKIRAKVIKTKHYGINEK